MRVSIIPASELSEQEAAHVSERVCAAEHKNDGGARSAWENLNWHPKLFVVYVDDNEQRSFMGLLTADGPPDETCPTWWIDGRHRGKRLGKPMIDAFIPLLRARGVTGIGRISIQTYLTAHDAASTSLAKYLRVRFATSAA